MAGREGDFSLSTAAQPSAHQCLGGPIPYTAVGDDRRFAFSWSAARELKGEAGHLSIGLGIRACQAGHRVAFAIAAEWGPA